MGINGFRVVDADGHGGELPDWQQRIPAALGDRLAAWKQRCKDHYARLAIPGGGHIVNPGADLGDAHTVIASTDTPEAWAAMLDFFDDTIGAP